MVYRKRITSEAFSLHTRLQGSSDGIVAKLGRQCLVTGSCIFEPLVPLSSQAWRQCSVYADEK